MRIGYDHTIFARHRRGGISRYFCELAARLRRRQTVVVSAPLYTNLHLRNVPDIVRGTYLDFGWGTGTIADVVGRVLGPILLGDVDVLHETFYSKESPYPRPRCGRAATVHDMIHELFYPAGEVSLRKRATIARADLILCVSNKTRDDLLNSIKVPEARVRVVHLGYELQCSGPNERLGEPSQVPYLLVVGPRGEYKNFSLLLKALSMSRHLRDDLGLICFGGPPLSSGEVQEIRRAGVRRFQYLSGDDSVLASYYRSAHALVMPALYEGFGIPILEAMSFGCPVCCSNGGALPEVAGEAGLFFSPTDAEECMNALERIAFDTNLRNQLRDKGLERIKHFGWQKCAEETDHAYRELC